jgi:hypothetical protein
MARALQIDCILLVVNTGNNQSLTTAEHQQQEEFEKQ